MWLHHLRKKQKLISQSDVTTMFKIDLTSVFICLLTVKRKKIRLKYVFSTSAKPW